MFALGYAAIAVRNEVFLKPMPLYRSSDVDHFDSIHSLMDELLCVPLKRDQSAAGVRLRNFRRVATPVGVFTPNTSTDSNAEGETPLAVRRGVETNMVGKRGLEPLTLGASNRCSTD